MLDNMKETTSTKMLPTITTAVAANAAAAAAAEECNEDVNKNSNKTNATPTKAKTILNWLKSATKSFDNTENIYNSNNIINNSSNRRFSVNNDCVGRTCETIEGSVAPEPNTAATPTPTNKQSESARGKSPLPHRDATLRDFRGVQTLRHLWNKRISASEETTTNRYKSFGNSTVHKLTKSISCLVNASNASIDSANQNNNNTRSVDELSERFNRTAQRKRAQSLHDCTQLEDDTVDAETEIDFLHREKDNFYKYKTAEQAAKHLAREAKVRAKAKRATAGIVSESVVDEKDASHFPAIESSSKGERIHWLRRQDIIVKRREEKPTFEQQNCNVNMAITDSKINNINNKNDSELSLSAKAAISNSTTTTSSNNNKSNKNNSKNNVRRQMPTLVSANNANTAANSAAVAVAVADSQSELSGGISSDTDTLTASNSPQYASRKRVLERETTTTTPSSKRASTDSSGSSNVTVGRTSSRRPTSVSARKYSFKTHARSYHHTPRKMNVNKDGSSGGGSGCGGGSNNFSMVAKLTQQFNEIIQKDKKLLEEVKRKNGVLMSRGGHVYKVVENTTDRASKNSSPSISRTSSRAKDTATTTTTATTRTSMVQRNIKRFESCGGGGFAGTVVPNDDKPKVPAKSTQVLRKLNEIAANKSQHINLLSNRSNISSKQLNHLNLPLQSTHSESQMKFELKKSSLSNSLAPLEVVKEEAKSPMDTEEKSMESALENIELQNVSNAKAAASTFCGNASNYCTQSVNNNSNGYDKVNAINQAETNGNVQNDVAQKLKQISNADYNSIEEKGENETTINGRQTPEGQEDKSEETTTTTTIDLEEQLKKSTTQTNDDSNVIYGRKTTEVREADGNAKSDEAIEVNTSDDLDGGVTDEKVKQRKHRYAKIYEKFRFRSPFSGGQSKKSSPSRSLPEEKQTKTKDITKSSATEITEINAEAEPEAQKIIDALEVVDEKLKGLSMTTESAAEPAIVLCENDDFEQRVLPNSSFVYQSSAKQVSNNQLIVTQAVNVTLVNNIEGEQMVMEQKELQLQLAKLGDTATIVGVGNMIISARKEDEETIYEPIAAQTTNESKTEDINPQQSFLFRSCSAASKTVEAVTPTTVAPLLELVEDIYQTVEEVELQKSNADLTPAAPTTSMSVTATTSGSATLNDYESIAGSCEQAVPRSPAGCNSNTHSLFDGYEICEPPADELTTTAAVTIIPTTPIVRNTNDELPELPKPKRRLPNSPMPGMRPPKPTMLAVESLSTVILSDPAATITTATTTTALELLNDNDDQHYYADDENIYDTIKGSHCYESLHSESVKLQKSFTKCSADTVSLTSNCYESITQYRRMVSVNGQQTAGSSSGSTLTISSDHKTNSLYEGSLTAGLLYGGAGRCGSSSGSTMGGCGGGSSAGSNCHNSTGAGGDSGGLSSGDGDGSSNHYSHSIAASTSDNSDEWIDISDTEADAGGGEEGHQVAKQQFIVVRERSKAHRSPDWSKRVRDKRLQQKKAMSCIEDDSDHYYETLSPLDNKRHSSQIVQRTNSHHKRNQDLPRYALGASQGSKKYSASAHALGNHPISDDYDSFDTDTDEIYETEDNLKNHNDSGVDIRNVKLPEPPSSTNQVYAIVRKFKNFISNKKSPSSSGGSQQKLYENSSQFYVSGSNIYATTPKNPKSKTHKFIKKTPTADADNYENTEFHSPPAIHAIDATKQLSTSEKNLSVHNTDTELLNTTTTLRSKSKSGKSFKSRLRKSLVGSTFDTKQLPALTPTRSTFYIEDPSSHGGSGELDSGFSEKASSGDLPVVAPISTPESQKFSTVARKAKKEAKAASSQRRRTTIGSMRPHDPPPPPPVAASTTSWYAECGVFKTGSATMSALPQDEQSLCGRKATQSQNGSMLANGVSWYTEAGLYQTSGISVASSSGSSGVSSTGNEGSVGDDLHSLFLNEPLYQIYSAAKLESISRDLEDHDSSTDGYEEIGQNRGAGDGAPRCEIHIKKHSRPTALQLVEPKNGPSRTLWSQIPEVISSCILPTLTPRERALQEAKFEIITSEASYLKSLNLLRSHFMNHPLFRDTNIVSPRDRKALFSYIVPVHECSDRLLTELESCWQDNIMLLGLSQRIYAIAEKYFHVYIAFCEHQGRMDRTLRRLKEIKGIFSQNLDLIESSATCCGLNLHSFLMLPMQRVTRLPLLIDAVFSKVNPNDDEYDSWKMTLAIMNKIVTQCNEAANRCEQAYEIERISRQLEFPTPIRALAIAPVGVLLPGSKPRFLVKKGELTHLIWRGDDAKLTFGKKFTKSTVFAFLFSDLLVLTKRKADEHFTVFDYCPRNMLTISSGDLLPQLPTKDISQTHKNLILMTLLENHERKTIELVLSCPSVSEQERWLQAMRLPEAETPGEKLYEQWDCPQVICKHTYETKEPDILNLEVGDVVNVSRKLPDGWYQGERIRDGAIGWFPGSYTEEVNSAHVRARNLKQRYRLLTFTATYLESQKRK